MSKKKDRVKELSEEFLTLWLFLGLSKFGKTYADADIILSTLLGEVLGLDDYRDVLLKALERFKKYDD